MKAKTRAKQIKESITGVKKVHFSKHEYVREMIVLEKQMVSIIPEDVREEYNIRNIAGIRYYVSKKNRQHKGIINNEAEFSEMCEEAKTMICRERAGYFGERQAMQALESVRCNNKKLHNLDLKADLMRAELDSVVITPKGIFIIETKNSSHDMIIDDRGNYFRQRGYMNFDYNIGEKVNAKETVLRKVLTEAGFDKNIKVEKIVAFANSRMRFINRYKYVKATHLARLPHIIDEYSSRDVYSKEDINHIYEILDQARCKEAVQEEFDFETFTEMFAENIAKIEEAEAPTFKDAFKSLMKCFKFKMELN